MCCTSPTEIETGIWKVGKKTTLEPQKLCLEIGKITPLHTFGAGMRQNFGALCPSFFEESVIVPNPACEKSGKKTGCWFGEKQDLGLEY